MKTKSTGVTPGKLQLVPPTESESGRWEVEDDFGRHCEVFGECAEAEANARRIVRCVNAEVDLELVQALERLLKQVNARKMK